MAQTIIKNIPYINNIPSYTNIKTDIIVATRVDGELWFYGSYKPNEIQRAVSAVNEYPDERVLIYPQSASV